MLAGVVSPPITAGLEANFPRQAAPVLSALRKSPAELGGTIEVEPHLPLCFYFLFIYLFWTPTVCLLTLALEPNREVPHNRVPLGVPGCGKGRPGWTGAHSSDCPVQSCCWPTVTLRKSVSFPTLEPAALMDAAGGCFRGPAAVRGTEFLVPLSTPPIPLIQEACRTWVILCWWGN